MCCGLADKAFDPLPLRSYMHCWATFLDALASLGSMLESQSVTDSFMFLRFCQILGISSGYVQSMFRVCSVDRFTKTFFWNFQSILADFCYILIYKQMLEKVFCSNIAPSLSSGNHLFYKAEYMGRSCPNQVWAITFDWSALAT